VIIDLRFAQRLQEVKYDPKGLSTTEQWNMVRTARIGIIVLGVGAILLGYIFLSSLPNLLDLLFVIFGMQTALAPSVFYGLLGQPRSVDARAGIGSLAVGGLAAIVCLLFALGGATLLGVSLGLWSPIMVLTLSSVTFVLLLKKP
jgi:Na+/proline symporter